MEPSASFFNHRFDGMMAVVRAFAYRPSRKSSDASFIHKLSFTNFFSIFLTEDALM